jgi:hypothetical protein
VGPKSGLPWLPIANPSKPETSAAPTIAAPGITHLLREEEVVTELFSDVGDSAFGSSDIGALFSLMISSLSLNCSYSQHTAQNLQTHIGHKNSEIENHMDCVD